MADTATKPRKLAYLDDQLKGMSPNAQLSVHYRLVGAASAYLDDARWKFVVDTCIAETKSGDAR